MITQPETRFAQSGDISIAYQIVGGGPLDLVVVPGFVSHLEQAWEEPAYARFLQRLASFSRLILFDKRATGLSERITGIPTLEQRMDDVRAVMDAAGSQRAALFGISEGGPMSVTFAATYPERVSALVLYGSIARGAWDSDYPWGDKPEDGQTEAWLEAWRKAWGSPYGIEDWAPSAAHDDRFRQWWAKYLRLSTSPGAIANIIRMNISIDVRAILPTIHVPTLILHRAGDRTVHVEQGRYLAEHIPGARFVELGGDDHLWWVGDSESLVNEIQGFLTGEQQTFEPDRVLATVLFTDIVNSTRRASQLGDRRWRDLLNGHNELIHKEIGRFHGRAIKSTGDGFLATFDGPARAIRCAFAIRDQIQQLGIEIRAGLHTGEIELMGDDVGGIAIHIAARVLEQARANTIWVSRTVKDLVVGSDFSFSEQGSFQFKGIPEEWRLFTVDR
ncbi:MAG: adenylate/guanylate cyclase domain-containing protein [Chloroflexi bacterium]|nr:adenylate/guanylate cyclase domain-containing protein [Chloroflexota bacterium]